MKQSNILKALSLFLVVVASALALASCSSDDVEPDYFGHGVVNIDGMLPYSDLPGTWMIESIKDSETGVVTQINQKVTIADFTPIKDSVTVKAEDYQMWGHSYDGILSYDGVVDPDDEKSLGILIDFCKKPDQDLNSSLISCLYLGAYINAYLSYLTESFFLSNFKYFDGLLLCSNSAYHYESAGETRIIDGVVTMRRL